jgi:hypothetical protein
MKIIAACQDPGGCNALLPVINELRRQQVEVVFLAAEYSKEILKRKNIFFEAINNYKDNSVKNIFKQVNPDIVISGTSFGYSLEDVVIQESRSKNIPSLAILDSWMNYSARFSDLDKGCNLEYLPDLVCVPDKFACSEMVREGISLTRLVVTGNPYFDDCIKDISVYAEQKKSWLKKKDMPRDSRVISFFSQRIDATFGKDKTSPKYLGYNQYDVVNLLIRVLDAVVKNCFFKLVVVLRPHPKESTSFYENIVQHKSDCFILVDPELEARQLIAISDIVVGMFSTTLIEAYMAGKNIISIQPSRIKDDQFVLSRRGLIKPAEKSEDLCEQINAALSGSNVNLSLSQELGGRGATDKVIALIENMGNLKKGWV